MPPTAFAAALIAAPSGFGGTVTLLVQVRQEALKAGRYSARPALHFGCQLTIRRRPL